MEAINVPRLTLADLLGKADVLGALKPGYYADIVVVKKNPLQNISVIKEIAFVMKDGTIYKQNGTVNPKAFGLK